LRDELETEPTAHKHHERSSSTFSITIANDFENIRDEQIE